MLSPRFRHHLGLLSSVGLLVAIAACERPKPATRADSLAQQPESAATASPVAAEQSGWDATAGPLLLVQGENRSEAIVLFPSAASGEGELHALASASKRLSLFGRGGVRTTAVLADTSLSQEDVECRVWPVRPAEGDGGGGAWAVGLAEDAKLAAIPLDSVEVLTTRDSMALVAEAARLASAVTAITDPTFQGLRFTVYDIRRFEATPGVQAIVAHVVRKVNQEANPQEEQTLIIAERDSGVTAGPYQLAFAERTHGLEEQSTTPEVIAGVRIAGRPTLVVARDSDAGVAYALLERTGRRQWRVRWTSSLTRCG